MQPTVKNGLLVESNSVIKDCHLESVIKRNEQITEHYELEKDCFARGKFAQVRRISHRKSGQVFAAKSIKKRRPRYGDVTDEILHEIRVLLTSDHCERIVKLHEVFETRTEYILVLELASGGELQQILDEEECIEEVVCRRLMRQIVEGVKFLHTHQIAHLDIKPQNLLLTSGLPSGEVKLCDFGISRKIADKCEIREIMGTTDYMPPEILQYEPISLQSDMWSIGIVAYVLLSGHSPFGGDDKVHTYSNITSGALEFPERLFEGVSEQAKDFIRKCLVREPSDRMTCDECMAHDWLTSTDDSVMNLKENLVMDVQEEDEEEVVELLPEVLNCAEAEMVDKDENTPSIVISGAMMNNGVCDTISTITNESESGQKAEDEVMHTSVTLTLPPPRRSSTSLSYDSDKENHQVEIAVSGSGDSNKCPQQQLTDLMQSNVISFNNLTPFAKSHKRLSSDIFPSSDHQRWIAVVSAGSGGSGTTISTLKKYTSESAMSTIECNGGGVEDGANSGGGDPNNNSMMKQEMMQHSVHEIPIVVEGASTISTSLGANNNNDPSPPSTPNKKIYLSVDDSMSFCPFGSTSDASLFSKLFLPISLSNSSSNSGSRIRSVSVERLNTSARVTGHYTMLDSSSPTHVIGTPTVGGLCEDSKMLPADVAHSSAHAHQYHHLSASTISTSSSSTSSSSLSSLVSTNTTIFTKHALQKSHHHQQEVSSPGF